MRANSTVLVNFNRRTLVWTFSLSNVNLLSNGSSNSLALSPIQRRKIKRSVNVFIQDDAAKNCECHSPVGETIEWQLNTQEENPQDVQIYDDVIRVHILCFDWREICEGIQHYVTQEKMTSIVISWKWMMLSRLVRWDPIQGVNTECDDHSPPPPQSMILWWWTLSRESTDLSEIIGGENMFKWVWSILHLWNSSFGSSSHNAEWTMF